MADVVSINGKITPAAEAVISVLDRGFLYGDSVFEVLRTYRGQPFAESEHLKRLAVSCERLLIELPVPIATISKDLHAALAAAENDESYIRVIITRGSGPVLLDLRTAQDPARVIIVLPLPTQPAEMYTQGVEVSLVASSRATDSSRATGAKASNYQPNMLALHEAKQRGAYESIFVVPHGDVSEGASRTLFVVRSGKLITPPIRSGILEGITRRYIIEVAKALNIPLVEHALFPSDVYTAEEVFITSTLREVVPVVRVYGTPIADTRPGPITQRILERFRTTVAG